MGIFTTECANCGSKDHATKDCPQGILSSKCTYCGSTEHRSSDCPHGLMSSKCEYCGSKDHATRDCPHGLMSNKCEYCGSTEHATKNCPHGILSNKCANCGSKNHSTSKCPHRTGYTPQTDSSSSNSGCGTIIAWLIGGAIAIAVAIWLAVNIVLPIVLLNSALACMILALVFKRLRILFAIVALVGGAYMLTDIINGWFSLNFVNNIVKDKIWISIFVYVNTIAVGISTGLLVHPLWLKAKKIKSTSKGSSIIHIIVSILLIIIPMSSIPIVYHIVHNPLSFGLNYTTPINNSNNIITNQPSNTNNTSVTNVVYMVTAKAGLILRSGPGLNYNKIISIPYGTNVSVIERTDVPLTFENKSGHWVKVKYNNNIGYAFDGFLDNNNSNQSNWNTFWAAFTTALKQKDKTGLLNLALNEADFDGGAGFETPDMWATRMVSDSEWKKFVNDVNKGVVPDTYRNKGGKITNDCALYFEFKNNKWYWAGVLVD